MAEDRLLREAEAAARLSHPNIVTIHDVGRSEFGPYLILELLHGNTLARRLQFGPVPFREALRIGLDVARGSRTPTRRVWCIATSRRETSSCATTAR